MKGKSKAKSIAVINDDNPDGLSDHERYVSFSFILIYYTVLVIFL